MSIIGVSTICKYFIYLVSFFSDSVSLSFSLFFSFWLLECKLLEDKDPSCDLVLHMVSAFYVFFVNQ